ncbi:MAG: hypothetical protein A2234_07810 [Elusimicrobia bacterium RIFOXYA2_FULL_58_8]|nr:MAG: hypothetical protein A2234_07810 [Elusimicrobia bacterium RIFOXYA2_FULL_58_8]OGS14170.1 MAG: hypothetical protein A2285_07880 [Elusimicrobia bacterium RIFOXYA12_FULL_57_11]
MWLMAAVVLCLWVANSHYLGLFSDKAGLVLGFGRLAALAGTMGVLGQLLVMSRASWLVKLPGTPLPVKWHHRAGLVIPLALLAHPPLVVWHYSLQGGQGFMAQYLAVLRWDYVLAAACGEVLLIAAVLCALPCCRARIGYPAWQRLHLLTYAGLALTIGHQLALGGDLSVPKYYFASAWYMMLAFTGLNALWFRLLKPVYFVRP